MSTLNHTAFHLLRSRVQSLLLNEAGVVVDGTCSLLKLHHLQGKSVFEEISILSQVTDRLQKAEFDQLACSLSNVSLPKEGGNKLFDFHFAKTIKEGELLYVWVIEDMTRPYRHLQKYQEAHQKMLNNQLALENEIAALKQRIRKAETEQKQLTQKMQDQQSLMIGFGRGLHHPITSLVNHTKKLEVDYSELQQLEQLATQFAEYETILTKDVPLKPHRFAISDFLEELQEQAKKKRQVNLQYEISNQVPDHIQSDCDCLLHALINLISLYPGQDARLLVSKVGEFEEDEVSLKFCLSFRQPKPVPELRANIQLAIATQLIEQQQGCIEVGQELSFSMNFMRA